MKRFIIATAVLAVTSALPAEAPAQSLNVKAGGWDMKMTMTGGPPGAPREMAYKTCVTKEDLDRASAFQKDDDCTYSVKAATAARWAGTMNCKREDGATTGEFDIQAKSPDTILMTASAKPVRAGKGPGEMRMEVTGRWASASCKGYED
jgi:hypothetical protein